MTSWTREQATLLIKIYEGNPVLYDSKHREYCNSDTRKRILKEMCEAVSTFRPGVTEGEILKKINGLRTQMAECLRTASKSSECSNEEAIKPTLWCFDMMRFLVPHLTRRKSSSNSNSIGLEYKHEPSANYTLEFSEEDEKDSTRWAMEEHEFNTNDPLEMDQSEEMLVTRPLKTVRVSRKRARPSKFTSPTSQLLRTAVNILNNDEEDKFTKIGAFVASELRQIKCDRTFKKCKRAILVALIAAHDEDSE